MIELARQMKRRMNAGGTRGKVLVVVNEKNNVIRKGTNESAS